MKKNGIKTKKPTMAQGMKILTGTAAFFFCFFMIAYRIYQADVILSLCITFGVIFYHFAMRLAVGFMIDRLFHNKMNYRKKWFQPLGFEKKLYAFLQVRRWKKHIPTYDPDTFSPKLHSWEEIVMATCQAEVVHELIVLLSFAPIFLTIPFEADAVFLITSFLSALTDMIFVILQRYNRPKIISILTRKHQTK